MEKNNLMELTGKVNPLKAFPFAIQQVLAMFVTNLTPLMLIAGIPVLEIPNDVYLALCQNAMNIAGIATLIQSTPIWKIGSGLPIFMGMSFTFIVPLCNIAVQYGYGAVMGTVIVGGVFEGLLGLSAKYLKKIIAPIVSATVVTGIGLSLFGSAARSFGGGYATDFGAASYLVTGFVTMVACILWQVLAKGTKKQLSILIGMVAGYITALCFGIVQFNDFSSIKIFALPKILPYTPTFHFDAILTICIIYIVSATETMGDATALAHGALHRNLAPGEISGAITADGFCSSLGGVFGMPPVTSFSETIGLTIMTKVVNRNVARIGALVLIVCGFFPPIGYFFTSIPTSVIGGVLIVVLGQIFVSGIQMIADASFTTRNKLIASISLAMGVGFTTATQSEIWVYMPELIKALFAENMVALIFVVSLILNLVLPKNMEFKPSGKEKN